MSSIESREAEDKARLKTLRHAARLGIEDIAAGRFRTLQSPKSLKPHLALLAQKAITASKSAK